MLIAELVQGDWSWIGGVIIVCTAIICGTILVIKS